MAVKKILCYCGCGLGTSFIMEMNMQNALQELGVTDVEVTHSTLDDVAEGAADLFVSSADLAHVAEGKGPVIGLKNLLDTEDYKAQLKPYFED